MPSIDEEIDALYAGESGAFTTARHALAKRGGDRAVEIKALVKPSLPAWAINQLYWHHRRVFDALVTAAEARRAAHVSQVAGRRADVGRADARHRAAHEAAVAAALATLREAREPVSAATIHAIERTLEAVPSPEIAGRLARPIEPVGFAALAALIGAAGTAAPRQPADVVVMKRPRSATATAVAGRTATADARAAREAGARRAERLRERETARLTGAMAAARTKEREVLEAFTRAREAAERSAAQLAALERELDRVRKDAWERRDEAERARQAATDAAAARVMIERKLQEMGE